MTVAILLQCNRILGLGVLKLGSGQAAAQWARAVPAPRPMGGRGRGRRRGESCGELSKPRGRSLPVRPAALKGAARPGGTPRPPPNGSKLEPSPAARAGGSGAAASRWDPPGPTGTRRPEPGGAGAAARPQVGGTAQRPALEGAGSSAALPAW